MTIFEQARAAITRGYIESTLMAPGAYWDGDEFWTLNPTRADSTVGSFSINGRTGCWHDFAGNEGGDLIDLLVAMRGGSKRDAAAEIIRAAGQTVEDQGRPAGAARDGRAPAAAKRPRVEPVVPATEEALKALNGTIGDAYFRERHGKPIKGWTYRTAEGAPAFAVVRYEKPDGSKDVLPFYWGADSRWHNGQALEHGRPLYKLDQIVRADRGIPILVVEGEKCASVDVPGYLVTTWSGGTGAVSRTDWAPLEGREVVIWPDADHQVDKAGVLIPWEKQPGMKAALAIANRLPGARILDVREKAVAKSGWDLADAITDGIDPAAFVRSCPTLAGPAEAAAARADEGAPFVALGYDSTRHWFMRRGVRIPFPITIGSWTQSKLLELADLSYWGALNLCTDQGSVKVAAAQDAVARWSREAGRYDPAKIRGAGVWRDVAGVVVNDGRRLVLPDGDVKAYDDYRSEFHYISSDVAFSDMHGPESTDEDGQILEDLFRAFSFVKPVSALLAMGWSLIAPFGGLLKWRPHVWFTGRRGTGKSYLLENVVAPLCGPFAHIGSGKDTEAGIRRALNQDARPVILDEMEPKNKAAQAKVSAILELARNASSDGSGYITIAGTDGGTQAFKIRSCFAFASVQAPDEGAAIASRIIRIELKVAADQAAKFRRTDDLYGQVMGDPGRFTRRIFRALPRILADIEFIRSSFLGVFGDQRQVDQIAPLIAAAWAVQSTETIRDSDAGRDWLAGWIGDLSTLGDDTVEDEDAVMAHILSAQVRLDDLKTRTVAELLAMASTDDPGYDDSRAALSRLGMKFLDRTADGSTRKFLAIAAKSDQITKVLAGTAYETGYDAQLRRHAACWNQTDTVPIRMAIGRVRCRLFDWAIFRAQYLDEMGVDHERKL